DATHSLLFEKGHLRASVLQLGGSGTGGDVGLEKILVLIFLFVSVVIGVIAMTKAQRRIPTQSAKHVRGRRVYGGTRNYLPLKVNQAGVMPVIFAGSLLMIPKLVFQMLGSAGFEWAAYLNSAFDRQGYMYIVMYIGMI